MNISKITDEVDFSFWPSFGVFGFPIFCIASQLLLSGSAALVGHPLPRSNGEGLPGMFLGVPLGAVTTLCSFAWQRERHTVSRLVAAAGGLVIGGSWLLWLRPSDPPVWISDFSFAVSPLAWAAALLLFAVLVKPHRGGDGVAPTP